MIDHSSGNIIGTMVSYPSDYNNDFMECFFGCIEKMRLLPTEIHVEKEEIYDFFKPVAII